MRKNNVKSPLSNFLAFSTLFCIYRAVKHMIKKYHKKQEIFY